MSNVTLSIDDNIIKQAKLRAIQEGISLSAKMRDLLQRYALGQLDAGVPDLSFADNARIFSAKQELDRDVSSGQSTSHQAAAPLAPNGISVDPDYLRKTRGWAREDLYDRRLRNAPWPEKPADIG